MISANFTDKTSYNATTFSPFNSKAVHHLLSYDLEKIMGLELSGEQRYELTKELLRYLEYHIDVKLEIKSHIVLHEVLH